MKKLFEYKTPSLTFNHLIYTKDDKDYFAKHSHNLCELIFVLHGEVSYVIENHKYVARANDLIMIKTLSYHHFKKNPSSNYEKISLLFPYDVASFLTEKTKMLHCENTYIEEIFKKLVYYHNVFSLEKVVSLLPSIINEIMWNVELLVESHTSIPQSISPIISNSIKYINENLFEIQNLLEICEHLNISIQHFQSCFKKELHISPHQYILEKRLLHAKNLLLAGKAPSHIYYECGFNSYPAFFTAFVKLFKCSPTDILKDASSGSPKGE